MGQRDSGPTGQRFLCWGLKLKSPPSSTAPPSRGSPASGARKRALQGRGPGALPGAIITVPEGKGFMPSPAGRQCQPGPTGGRHSSEKSPGAGAGMHGFLRAGRAGWALPGPARQRQIHPRAEAGNLEPGF